MIKAMGYASHHSFSRLKPLAFEREEAGPDEVEIEILYCGVCHSDVHQAANDWGNTVYPCVPGHEIVGRVTKAGANVDRHAVGDLVGVGCMIDSCRECAPCQSHDEQYCEGPNSWLATYNGPMVPAAVAPDGTNAYGRENTYGGYSNVVVVNQGFCAKDADRAADRSGGTDPVRGRHHLFAAQALGRKARSESRRRRFWWVGRHGCEARQGDGCRGDRLHDHESEGDRGRKLGARGIVEGDKEAYEALAKHFDLILSTIPEKHTVDPFIPLLAHGASYVSVGALAQMPGWNHQELIMGRRTIAGSLIGSIAETQEVLDFCAEHGIVPDVQMIAIQDINQAYKKILSGDVRFRYVIDMASLRREMAENEAA